MIGRRSWRWLALLAAAFALAWVLFTGLEAWRVRAELRLAQAEIGRGRFEPARRRLGRLASRHPRALGGAVDYWIGITEAASGRSEAAVRAFDRLPEGFVFDPKGTYLAARASLERGRLAAAERRLENALRRATPNRNELRSLLIRVYQVEARFDDVKGLLRDRLAEGADPIPVARELDNIDLGRLPHESLLSALEEAGRMAPEDDRVWLGEAREAILAGRWDDAARWLRRCREIRADGPVWRAWLDWARGSGRPDQALEAARRLDDRQLAAADRLALRAWFHELRGDRDAQSQALQQWLRLEPQEPRALERATTLAQRAGDAERVAELRHRKAEGDRALDHYRQMLWKPGPVPATAERLELARLAQAAGRRHEARALFARVLRDHPKNGPAREALARLDRADSDRRTDLGDADRPWPLLPAVAQAGRPAERGGEPRFTDDAKVAGLRFQYENGETPLHQLPEPFGGGIALLDYDGDDRLDVFCVQGGAFPRTAGLGIAGPGDRLFRNAGDGRFVDVTQCAGLADVAAGHGHGVSVGDFDNDGYPDLFVTRWRSYALYRNRGDGTFEDATETAGLGGDRDWPTSSAFADLDGDGDLDLYVCHYAVWDTLDPRLCRDTDTNAYVNCNPLESLARPDHLFRNDDGRFVDVTAEAGIVDRDGRGLGVVAADLDGDGLIDLFVANDLTANFLWRNRGGLKFEDTAAEAGVAGNAQGGYQAGMGVACGDLDGDGLIDLVVTNFYGESTTFYRNLGGGIFSDATAAIGMAAASRHLLGFGVVLFDFNNDGRLDLASANGHINDRRPSFPYFMPAQLLAGGPDGRVTDVTARAGTPWQVLRMGRGLAAGDLDGDGRVDLLLLGHNQPLAYFHNRSRGGHFASLRLEGRATSRDAVGAKVEVLAGGRRQVAQRVGGGSYQSASDLRLHFGLGERTRIESIEVTWPSGRKQRFANLAADAAYLVREGRDGAVLMPDDPKARPGGPTGYSQP